MDKLAEDEQKLKEDMEFDKLAQDEQKLKEDMEFDILAQDEQKLKELMESDRLAQDEQILAADEQKLKEDMLMDKLAADEQNLKEDMLMDKLAADEQKLKEEQEADSGEQMKALATLLQASHPEAAFASSGAAGSPVMGRQSGLGVTKQPALPSTKRSAELLMQDKTEVGELVAYMLSMKDLEVVPDDWDFYKDGSMKKDIVETMLGTVGAYFDIKFTADDIEKVTTVGAIKAKMR